jgi:hypothetical protein
MNKLITVNETEIINRIYIIRGQKIMLDKDLAEMYDVETFRLNEAVKRNISRFPEDFMFQLNNEEWESLKSQIATSNHDQFLISQFAISKDTRGGTRKLPYAFTEQGVAMLSSVLRSERAIQVNIQIIRVYTKMKEVLFDNKELWLKIEKIEQALVKKDEEVKTIFSILKKLLVQEQKPRKEIGFLASRNKK